MKKIKFFNLGEFMQNGYSNDILEKFENLINDFINSEDIEIIKIVPLLHENIIIYVEYKTNEKR